MPFSLGYYTMCIVNIYWKCEQRLAIYLTHELHTMTDYNAIFQQIYELHLTMTRQTMVYQQLLIWRLWKILVIKRLPAVSRMRHCATAQGSISCDQRSQMDRTQ